MIIKELKKFEDLDAGIKLWNENYTKYSLNSDLYRQDGFYRGPNVNFGGKSGVAYAGLGPLGLAEGCRGKGLSTPFLQQILKRLYNAGYREITIDWTTLVEYYKRFGYEVVHKYIPLQKELN